MYFTSSLLLNVLVHVMFDGSVAQSDCSDCCVKGKYKEIDEPRRSIKSIWKVGQNALCDINLPWGWYRFTSFTGGEMPTSIVNPNRCGTAAPVWIKKANPSEKDGTVVREACINLFGINNGCSQSFNIKVRNCSSYYVYFLGPTYSCAVAYCAGKRPLILTLYVRLESVTNQIIVYSFRKSHQVQIWCSFKMTKGPKGHTPLSRSAILDFVAHQIEAARL